MRVPAAAENEALVRRLIAALQHRDVAQIGAVTGEGS
jgi:hypothetical protein